MEQKLLHELIALYQSGKISPEDKTLLMNFFLEENENREKNVQVFNEWMQSGKKLNHHYDDQKWLPVLRFVLDVDKPGADTTREIDKRNLFRYRNVFKYAASVAILFSLGVMTFLALKKINHTDTILSKVRVEEEIAPGSQKAILTISDGTEISIDSTSKGIIAQFGEVSVQQTEEGELFYHGIESGETRQRLHNLRTPRGGQYKLTLPDGSRVWLNAASSITYPASFTGNQRWVTVKGEVYIEVAADKNKPFFVNVDNKLTLRALGTAFNITSYPEDAEIRTTLTEGKVQVYESNELDSSRKIILMPGQQAVKPQDIRNGTLQKKMLSNKDVERIIAWKNGYFDFDSVSINEMAMQIERWYDVNFIFKGNFSNVKFRGKMDREVKIEDVIKFFEDYAYKIEVKNRVITVSK